MKNLVSVLRRVGKPPRVFTAVDGARMVVLPYGGRVLGLFTPRSGENIYWTHPALRSVKTARAFYASTAWHNSGGDRTWIAPEVDVFLPGFPALERHEQQRALDPGHYRVTESRGGFRLENRFRLRLSRLRTDVGLKITKSFGWAPNPLRHERGLDLSGVEYAGYSQRTSLEITGTRPPTKAQVGLWSLLQLPHGGDLLLPTFSRHEPLHIFSTVGAIPSADLIVREHLVRYRMRQKGEHKISLRAAHMTGRAGYLHRTGSRWSLVIRNFVLNPSGEYVDVPWKGPVWLGFAVQACNVNSGLGAFSELEYHVPAIGYNTGCVRCDDTTQVWAFRGPKAPILTIAHVLLTGKGFAL